MYYFSDSDQQFGPFALEKIKLAVFLYLPIFLFLSCSDHHNFKSIGENDLFAYRPEVKDINYLEKLNKFCQSNHNYDSKIFLGFDLGESKEKVSIMFDSLLTHSIINYNKLPITLCKPISYYSNAGWRYETDTVLWEGFNYQFEYISKFNGFLNLGFDSNKLETVKLTITNTQHRTNEDFGVCFHCMKLLLMNKFGEPVYVNSSYDFNSGVDLRPESQYIWLNGNKEIQLITQWNYCWLYYSNINFARKEELKLQHEEKVQKYSDSLNIIYEKEYQEKEENRIGEELKKTEKNF